MDRKGLEDVVMFLATVIPDQHVWIGARSFFVSQSANEPAPQRRFPETNESKPWRGPHDVACH